MMRAVQEEKRPENIEESPISSLFFSFSSRFSQRHEEQRRAHTRRIPARGWVYRLREGRTGPGGTTRTG